MTNITQEVTQAVRNDLDCSPIESVRFVTGRSERAIIEACERSTDLYFDPDARTITYVGPENTTANYHNAHGAAWDNA